MERMLPMLILGVLIAILGIVNIRGNISTIHWYNRRRVSEADRPKYGRCVGAGTLVIGGALILSALLEAVVGELAIGIFVMAACAVGMGLILYGQFKYNKGLF